MFYSKKMNGFYTQETHGNNIPADAVEITPENHATLMQGQAEGKVIAADENGYPILIDPPPHPAYVPQQVTRRQGRLALIEVGKLADVETAIAAISDPIEQLKAQVEYEADTWERSNEFLQTMWAQLGGTEQQLDNLFLLASTK